jgi:TorA maturation chaperone TorD
LTKKEIDTSINVLGEFRLAFYLLLSRAFSRELNKAVLEDMEQISGTLMEAWKLLGLPSDPDVKEGRVLLKAFFLGLGDDVDSTAQGLAREYASLFLGVGPVTISPCESVYRSASGLLYQSTLLEVQQSYNEIGMAKSDLYQEPDDHIAIELSYMARLCEMTQEAAKTEKEKAVRSLELQRDFLDAHILQWVPLFSQRLIAAAPSGFYRAMAHLLKGYTGIDKSLIESITRQLHVNSKPKIERREEETKHS